MDGTGHGAHDSSRAGRAAAGAWSGTWRPWRRGSEPACDSSPSASPASAARGPPGALDARNCEDAPWLRDDRRRMGRARGSSITFATGKQNAVDIIAGSNKDEHTSLGGNIAFRDTMMWAMRLCRASNGNRQARLLVSVHARTADRTGRQRPQGHARDGDRLRLQQSLGATRDPRRQLTETGDGIRAGSENGRRDVVLLGQL